MKEQTTRRRIGRGVDMNALGLNKLIGHLLLAEQRGRGEHEAWIIATQSLGSSLVSLKALHAASCGLRAGCSFA